MKEEFEVSDYGIFTDGVVLTNSLKEKVGTLQESLSSFKSVISNQDVFLGPAADVANEDIDTLQLDFNDVSDNFQKISDYLITTNDNYQKGDYNASVQLRLEGVGAVASDYANPANLSGSHLEFINSIKDGAVEAYNEYGVLPSLTMAQAILETGRGKSKIGNNIFGIKAGSGWTGKRINCATQEQRADGSYYTINADFRDYDSVSDSIVDHAELLSTDLYQPVIDSTNYVEACHAVKNCGYATSLDYADNLISIIEDYGLNQWDPVV